MDEIVISTRVISLVDFSRRGIARLALYARWKDTRRTYSPCLSVQQIKSHLRNGSSHRCSPRFSLFLPMRMDNIKNITGTSCVCVCVRVREREKYTDRVVSSLLFFCVLQVRWGHFSAAHHRSYMQADRAILTAITYVSLHVYSVSILIMNEAVAYTARLVRSKFAHDSLSLSLFLPDLSLLPIRPIIICIFHFFSIVCPSGKISFPGWNTARITQLQPLIRFSLSILVFSFFFPFASAIFILYTLCSFSFSFCILTLSLLLPDCRRCWWRFYLTFARIFIRSNFNRNKTGRWNERGSFVFLKIPEPFYSGTENWRMSTFHWKRKEVSRIYPGWD